MLDDNVSHSLGGPPRRQPDGGRESVAQAPGTYERFEEYDRQLLSFVANWAPYGGPPAEEVLPRFGFPSDRVRQRVLEVADRYHQVRVSSQDRALMTRALVWVRQSGGVCRA